MKLSDQAIKHGKSKTSYGVTEPFHEHNDCIRIAYEWIDAQKCIRSKTKSLFPVKHLIERWAGRYVSTADVIVAANLHPNIFGSYPYFNISSKLTEPSIGRLNNIPEANQHDYRERHETSIYLRHEKQEIQ